MILSPLEPRAKIRLSGRYGERIGPPDEYLGEVVATATRYDQPCYVVRMYGYRRGGRGQRTYHITTAVVHAKWEHDPQSAH